MKPAGRRNVFETPENFTTAFSDAGRIRPVENLLPGTARQHQVGLAQQSEMVRYRRLSHDEVFLQFTHTHLARLQERQDALARLVSHHFDKVVEVTAA